MGGRYRLGQLLGAGSFGRVYEGHHTSLAQRVAIKVFRPDIVAMAGGADRVLMDVRAASRVHHRNIVDVHDLGRLDDTVYVATELVLGRTLHGMLVESGRLPWSRARAVALQIAAALKAAHKRNVVHRGLRAANCFVLESPAQVAAELRIKVSDFGFAHPALAGGGRGEEHTPPFVGDTAYTAPELNGGAATSVRSDVYAFGVLLYRMLTGVLPFEGGTPYQVLAAHASQPVPPLRGKVRSVPAEVEAIVLRALAKDPSERFESARELELALEEVATRGDDLPEAALDEVETGQHAQAKAPQVAVTHGPAPSELESRVPPPPARDDAMHAAFDRREEVGELHATSMFDRQMLVPYFGPAVADHTAPPEPTIQLGASMFSELGPQARPVATAFPQLMSRVQPVAPALASPTSGDRGEPLEATILDAGARPPTAESTVVFSGRGARPLPTTERLQEVVPRKVIEAAVDEPTLHFLAGRPVTATILLPERGRGLVGASLPASPVLPTAAVAPSVALPAISPPDACIPAPVPAQALAPPGAPTLPPVRPAVPGSAPVAISLVQVLVIGVAVAIAGALVGLAIACPAGGPSSFRSPIEPRPLAQGPVRSHV